MIDKILINSIIQDSNNCPHCEEHLVEEMIGQVVLEDDIEESLEYACGELTECSGCHADNMNDFKRM